ncbi:polysaccharide pyruvyl transferase family protein [Bengtsoniella intestinalis]|uniref:polysaccharide pyruvyl transferase family protein n=1 Tax=Bengtsoniella intestinalis TaxID=3073143 RepID=UPI00391F5B8F
MNAGLLTFYHTHHYGTFLQAYATQQAVEALGAQCTLLDYHTGKKNTLFRKPQSVGSAVDNLHTSAHYKDLKRRYDRFEQAKATHLRKSSIRFHSSLDLAKGCPEVDVLLTGSNQIWNAKLSPSGQFDPVFFGDFSHKRKIAYAPSFGSSQLPPQLSGDLAGYLSHFSHVSVRERQGAEMVKDATGQDVPVVLDPTLLLSKKQWAALAVPPKQTGGYILCYCIHKESAMASYVRQLSKRTGLPIVQLCGVSQKVHPKATCVLDAGPQEFLGLFQNASYVCTNSFHGTVFSTVFEKPFFSSVSLAEIHSPNRSRTYNLLSTLGLTQRIIGKGDTAGLLDPIDYQAVANTLAQARDHSLSYLKAALQNVPFVPQSASTPQPFPSWRPMMFALAVPPAPPPAPRR